MLDIGANDEHFPVSLEPEPDAYPESRMGAVAVARQAFLDAAWWRDAEREYAARPAGRARPRLREASAALAGAIEGKETVVFETTDVLALLRAMRVAKERNLKARYVSGGDEYRLAAEVAAARPDLVLRVAFPQPEKLDRDLGTLYACDGNAGKSEAYNDIGFITLVAYFYDTLESANSAHERNANPTVMKDIQPINDLGQRAVSYVDGRAVAVSVQDGTFHFSATWSPNGTTVPAGVREALVETTRATLSKLKAT